MAYSQPRVYSPVPFLLGVYSRWVVKVAEGSAPITIINSVFGANNSVTA